MKALICLPLLVFVLAGCAGKTGYRDSCGTQIDAAWHELDLAKAEASPEPSVTPRPCPC